VSKPCRRPTSLKPRSARRTVPTTQSGSARVGAVRGRCSALRRPSSGWVHRDGDDFARWGTNSTGVALYGHGMATEQRNRSKWPPGENPRMRRAAHTAHPKGSASDGWRRPIPRPSVRYYGAGGPATPPSGGSILAIRITVASRPTLRTPPAIFAGKEAESPTVMANLVLAAITSGGGTTLSSTPGDANAAMVAARMTVIGTST
jgi:hypothetical protein